MPDMQVAVAQETLWRRIAEKPIIGLPHKPAAGRPAGTADAGAGLLLEQAPPALPRDKPAETTVMRTAWVTNPEGLHLRTCLAVTQLAAKFQARVTIQKDGQCEDASSLLGLLTLAAAQGAQLTLSAVGPDAEEAVQGIVDLLDLQVDDVTVSRQSWHLRTPR